MLSLLFGSLICCTHMICIYLYHIGTVLIPSVQRLFKSNETFDVK